VFQFSIWKCIAVVKAEQAVLGGAGMVSFNSLFEMPSTRRETRTLRGGWSRFNSLFEMR